MGRLATDLLRVTAGTFIIFNHTGWNLYIQIEKQHPPAAAYVISLLNQLGKPAVLFFLFLSGFAFARYRLSSNFRSVLFYKNRASRILPPYTIVTILFLLEKNLSFSALKALPAALASGSAAPHLYFIPLIGLFYFFFPLLRRVPYSVYSALSLGFIFIAFYLAIAFLNQQTLILGLKTTAERFVFFNNDTFTVELYRWGEYVAFGLPFFWGGIWLGAAAHPVRRAPKWIFFASLAAIVAAYSLVLLDFFVRLESGLHPDNAGRIWRISVVLYAIVLIWFFWRFLTYESTKWLRELARCSFLVYLIHPFFIFASKQMPASVQIPLVIVLSWSIALFLQYLARKHSVLGFCFGEGDRIWAGTAGLSPPKSS